jgi:hypothetical protein
MGYPMKREAAGLKPQQSVTVLHIITGQCIRLPGPDGLPRHIAMNEGSNAVITREDIEVGIFNVLNNGCTDRVFDMGRFGICLVRWERWGWQPKWIEPTSEHNAQILELAEWRARGRAKLEEWKDRRNQGG